MAKRNMKAAPRQAYGAGVLLRLLGYYAVLIAALVLVSMVAPPAEAANTAQQPLVLPGLMQAGEGATALGLSWQMAVTAAVSMAGALALMLPVAQVYRLSRRPKGEEDSLAQTLLILPVAVCAIAMLVQHSLPLAFSLAGIVAAVRFRNTLQDPRDAVYVFVAIGVGLASGIGALAMAAMISALFSAVVLILARLQRGGAASLWPRAAKARAVAASVPAVWPLLPSASSWATPGTPGTKKQRRVRALLVVEAVHGKPAWRAVEAALGEHAHDWKLLSRAPEASLSRFECRVRLRHKSSPAQLLEDLRRRGGEHIRIAGLITT